MRSFRTLATYGFLGVMAFVSVFPFAWMIIGATNTSADIIKGRSWPGSALAENLSTLVTTNNVPEILYNSFKIAIIGTALTLLVASMAGYGFEVFKSRFKDRVFGGLLLLMSIPFAALMVPLFVLTGKIGLINTHIGVILPSVAALSLLFIMFYFRQATIAFPSELRDAARVVGNYRLPGATLYVTLEPCTMCAGAMVHARVATLVFGATEPRAGVVCSTCHLLDEPWFNHRVAWEGGVLAEESSARLKAFFQARR